MAAPFTMETPPQYLMAQRPVEPQLDMRNLLTSLAGAYQAPQTSYFGLTPENVQSSAGQQLQRMAEMGGMIQQAQKMGVGQEQQQFADALNAHKMYLADRDQRMQEALNGLRMQQMKQAMGQSAASHALSMANAKMQNQLLQTPITLQGVMDANGEPITTTVGALKALGPAAKYLYGGGGGGGTAAAQNAAGAFGNVFSSPADQQAAAKIVPNFIARVSKALQQTEKAFVENSMNYGQSYTPDMHNAEVDKYFDTIAPFFANQDEFNKLRQSYYRPAAIQAQEPVQGKEKRRFFKNDYQPDLVTEIPEESYVPLREPSSQSIAPVAPQKPVVNPANAQAANAFLRQLNLLQEQSKLKKKQAEEDLSIDPFTDPKYRRR